MICGGRDKNIDFSVLSQKLQGKVKKMFVIGEAKEKFQKTFHNVISLESCESLEDAIVKARANASKGDCVLLSPMCASFDMFANFEERGRIFKEAVNRTVIFPIPVARKLSWVVSSSPASTPSVSGFFCIH